MAETTWRCSQCGTVNEPGSRACAGCGKWPSLFDLQEDVDEPDAFEPAPFEDGVGRPGPPIDVEVFDPEPFESEELESESASDDEPEPHARREASVARHRSRGAASLLHHLAAVEPLAREHDLARLDLSHFAAFRLDLQPTVAKDL